MCVVLISCCVCVAEMLGAVVISMVLAILYEGLKSLREYLMCLGLQSNWNKSRVEKSCNDGEEKNLLNSSATSMKHKYVYIIIMYDHLCNTQ